MLNALKTAKRVAIFAGLVLAVGEVAAKAAPIKKGPPMMPASQSGGSKSGGRDWIISLPVMAERPQLRLHAEYNAARSVGLALEAAQIASTEELSEEEIKETGNSLAINGFQGSLLMSRYSDPANMGGFFWSLGAGYRKWDAEWKKKPDAKEFQRATLVDEEGYLHHRVEGKGATAHIRVGYRYVANEWPLAVGGHVGLRHMNSQVTDVSVKEDEQTKLHATYSKVDDQERKQLKHKMMTTPDFTVDFGLAF
jgi:hypothetical protein